MSRIKILVSCHKETDYIKNEIFQPIQLGCANTDLRMPKMLYDDEGENISALNASYCELTAQYWAWKNMDADYYGFCHYRRYFSFSDKNYDEDPYGNVIEKCIEQSVLEKHGLNDNDKIKALIESYDVITTSRKDLRKMHGNFATVKQQYHAAKLLHGKDLETILDIIDEQYPDYSKAAHEHCNGYTTSFCNMYILRKEIFFEYCEWMFAILREFCKRTDMSRYSTEALRTPGHLSERLFGIYYLHMLEKKPNLKTKELQCVLFEKTDPQEPLKPAFYHNSVPVVFAANNQFVPMFAACLRSVIDHSTLNYNYDIVLLHSDISEENKLILKKMVEGIKNISLRLFDVTHLIVNYNLKANAHISVETYYRFLIQDVLPDYEKILYLDCDLVVNADVAELYQENLDGYMLAAVRDADFLGQINGANKETQKYIKEQFVMKDAYNYFQAGVILFNEKEMRKAYSLEQWLTFASKPYKYNDQDVLNLYCEGKVKFIDMAWNLITDCDHYRVANVIVYAPDSVQKEYKAAHANPKIIHYAGFMKPWHNPTEDYAQYFWDALRRTPFYEEMLCRLIDRKHISWGIYDGNSNLSFMGKIVKKIKGGIQCCKDHGVLYTIRYAVKKMM